MVNENIVVHRAFKLRFELFVSKQIKLLVNNVFHESKVKLVFSIVQTVFCCQRKFTAKILSKELFLMLTF